jgi:hypothetical protein
MKHTTHRCLSLLSLAFGLGLGCAQDGDVLNDDGASGGVTDSCTGKGRDACTGNCVGIWGTPYQRDPSGDWCLFSNGLEFLGCREASSCPQSNGTTLCSGSDSWRITSDCIPAETDAEVCEPPVADAPFC